MSRKMGRRHLVVATAGTALGVVLGSFLLEPKPPVCTVDGKVVCFHSSRVAGGWSRLAVSTANVSAVWQNNALLVAGTDYNIVTENGVTMVEIEPTLARPDGTEMFAVVMK